MGYSKPEYKWVLFLSSYRIHHTEGCWLQSNHTQLHTKTQNETSICNPAAVSRITMHALCWLAQLATLVRLWNEMTLDTELSTCTIKNVLRGKPWMNWEQVTLLYGACGCKQKFPWCSDICHYLMTHLGKHWVKSSVGQSILDTSDTGQSVQNKKWGFLNSQSQFSQIYLSETNYTKVIH